MPELIIPPGLVCGIDEAGRGPLAGPVVAAAVILDPARPIPGLNDSKKLSERKRELLAVLVRERALAWAVAEASVEEIDRLNILQATMLAMQRAVAGLAVRPDSALVDGNRCPMLEMPVEAVIKGDGKIASIAAASILAKTVRDAGNAGPARALSAIWLRQSYGLPDGGAFQGAAKTMARRPCIAAASVRWPGNSHSYEADPVARQPVFQGSQAAGRVRPRTAQARAHPARRPASGRWLTKRPMVRSRR